MDIDCYLYCCTTSFRRAFEAYLPKTNVGETSNATNFAIGHNHQQFHLKCVQFPWKCVQFQLKCFVLCCPVCSSFLCCLYVVDTEWISQVTNVLSIVGREWFYESMWREKDLYVLLQREKACMFNVVYPKSWSFWLLNLKPVPPW